MSLRVRRKGRRLPYGVDAGVGVDATERLTVHFSTECGNLPGKRREGENDPIVEEFKEGTVVLVPGPGGAGGCGMLVTTDCETGSAECV